MDLLETSAKYGPQSATAAKQDLGAVRDLAAGDAEGTDDWKRGRSKGVVQDVWALFNALSKGAHIVRQDNGRV